jgi:hypothetical protein
MLKTNFESADGLGIIFVLSDRKPVGQKFRPYAATLHAPALDYKPPILGPHFLV